MAPPSLGYERDAPHCRRSPSSISSSPAPKAGATSRCDIFSSCSIAVAQKALGAVLLLLKTARNPTVIYNFTGLHSALLIMINILFIFYAYMPLVLVRSLWLAHNGSQTQCGLVYFNFFFEVIMPPPLSTNAHSDPVMHLIKS